MMWWTSIAKADQVLDTDACTIHLTSAPLRPPFDYRPMSSYVEGAAEIEGTVRLVRDPSGRLAHPIAYTKITDEHGKIGVDSTVMLGGDFGAETSTSLDVVRDTSRPGHPYVKRLRVSASVGFRA